MKAPKHLKHKPIIEVRDYEKIEPFATDAMALSLGRSQYSDGNDFSAKVWRKPGKRWSRQSEELPFHRVLDLSILVLKSIIDSKTSKTISQQTILEENICDAASLNNLHDYINKNIKHYEVRINELQALLLVYNKI